MSLSKQFIDETKMYTQKVLELVLETYEGKVIGSEDVNIEVLMKELFDEKPCKKMLKKKKIVKNNMDASKKGNKGEKGETRIIKYIFDNKDNTEIIYKIFSINSKVIIIDPSNNKIINDKDTIKKSSWKNKADIIIDFIDVSKKYYVSIKCKDGAAPTLLNHTSLCAKCWEEILKNDEPTLTKIIKALNVERKKGIYKEDIKYTDINLNKGEIKALINVISYFTFEGTGSSYSNCPADSVLVVGNSYDVSETSMFKDCKTPEMKINYINDILPNLRLSLRSGKGMPTKQEQLDKCKPWIYEHIDKKGNTKLCGALHIRFI